MYYVAILNLRKEKKHNLTPVDVVDFILVKAREKPLAHTVLLELRLSEIMWMLRDSERTGEKGSNPKLYRVAQKYALLLYATTNSYKYLRILANEAVNWHCASEADKAIFDAYLFTSETVNGKKIWIDKSVEWMMKDLRVVFGKHMKPHHELLLTRHALMLNEFKKSRASGQTEHSPTRDSSETKQIAVTDVFCAVALYMHESNVFGNGKVQYGTLDRAFKEKSGGSSEDMFSLDGNISLSNEFLFMHSISIDRVLKYFYKWYSETTGAVKRPNKEVEVRRIRVMMEDIEAAAKLNGILYTSTSVSQLKRKEFTKDDIVQLLEETNAKLPESK
eukprot:scaffold91542_cov48-Attheya_sp.AAC.4